MATNKKPTLGAAPKYTAPAYDEKKYRSGIDTSFYTKAINSYNAQAEKDRAFQIGEAGKSRDSALKQAYIQRAQNERTLNDNLAYAGIRGGATETSNLRLANQYGSAVGAANSDYANSVNSINQAIDRNKSDYASDMNSRAEEYRQNMAQARWQAAREDSISKYNAQREDYWNKYNAQREDYWNTYNAQREDYWNRFNAQREDKWKKADIEREEKWNKYNANNEYWNNYYLDKYSGYSKDSLKKAEKTVNANLKKAKTPAEKIRWQQALRAIGNRRGVIANAKK